MTPADFGEPTLAFRKRCAWEYFRMKGHADLHYATIVHDRELKLRSARLIGQASCRLRDLDITEGVGDE